MNLVERVIGLVAPHYCLSCGLEGALICDGCRMDAFPAIPERCYRCRAASPNSKVCARCRRVSRIGHVWVATEYTGLAKQLIHQLKFERASAAANEVAAQLNDTLPYLTSDIIVTHVPVATSRLRSRGYDQAKLVARELARLRRLHNLSLLGRLGQARQVGASRSKRLTQLQSAFWVSKPGVIKGKYFLLVDDVVTTGGTLEAAAAVLRANGARRVDAVVFTQRQ